MENQTLCLKYKSHNESMLSLLGSFQQKEMYVDVTISCEGQNIKAHKVILSACSPYFQNIFLENPCQHPIVIINGMKFEDISLILSFIYNGEVNVSYERLSSFLQAAEALKVKGLAEVCGEKNDTNFVSTEEVQETEINHPQRTDTPPRRRPRKRPRNRKRSLSDSNRSDDELLRKHRELPYIWDRSPTSDLSSPSIYDPDKSCGSPRIDLEDPDDYEFEFNKMHDTTDSNVSMNASNDNNLRMEHRMESAAESNIRDSQSPPGMENAAEIKSNIRDSQSPPDDIIKYMKTQVSPSSEELQSLEDAEKLLKDEVVIVGYFADASSSLKTAFMEVSDSLGESIKFAHTSNKEILDKYGFSDDIVLYRPKIFWNNFESNEVKYTKFFQDKEEIKKFIKENYHGLVGHRTHDNHEDFKNPLIVVYYDVDFVKNPKGTNYWRNLIMKVAENFKGQVTFAVSNKDKFSAEIEQYGLTPKGDTPVVAARNAANRKFNMKEEFSIENLETFVKKFLDGSLEPHLKSEPLPEKNDGPVKVAVVQNFQELVIDNHKDILIEFYAPWSEHCKKLAPTYEELGKEMQGENVEIVKMDAIANDVPSPFEVCNRFPILYWVPVNKKSSPEIYEGGQDLNDFIIYISKHSTYELTGYDRSGKKKAAN